VDEQGGGEILNKIFCSFPCLTQSVLDAYAPSPEEVEVARTTTRPKCRK